MSKKHLSVVMAGAMLATSVAPVLAATESSVTKDNLALKAREIKELAEKNALTKNSVLIGAANPYIDETIRTNQSGESAYGVAVLKPHQTLEDVEKGNVTVEYTTASVEDVVNGANEGDSIVIFKQPTSTFYGQLIAGTEPKKIESSKDTYKASDLTTTGNAVSSTFPANAFIESVEGTADGSKATITLKAKENPADVNSENKKIVVKVGDTKIDLKLALDEKGNLLDPTSQDNADLQKCVDFAELYTYNKSVASAEKQELVETIKVTKSETSADETFNVSDLYDGTLLTEKGTALVNEVKLLKEYETTHSSDGFIAKDRVEIDDSITNADQTTGINKSFKIKIKNKAKEVVKTITVKSTNLNDIKAFYKIVTTGNYTVGVLGGSNRYETAINIAKENSTKLNTTSGTNYSTNIVLVNGESLVDGLAASPLASSINTIDNASSTKKAPILLSKTDILPESTKKYIEDLLLESDIAVKDYKKIKVNLVGGTAVLSENLENELKSMGLTVVRYGGNDREETSLKVAEKLVANSANSKVNAADSFIVGAEGEADAMSISSVAANGMSTTSSLTKANAVTPIIVSSVHGLSEKSLDLLSKQTGRTYILGGTSSISSKEEDKILLARKDQTGSTATVNRISGDNRTETNTAILKKFYPANSLDAKPVIVAKDGLKNKSDLVDALTASSLGGAIVLVNNDVTSSQLVALKAANPAVTNVSDKAIQVGLGLDNSILKKVANFLDRKNPIQ